MNFLLAAILLLGPVDFPLPPWHRIDGVCNLCYVGEGGHTPVHQDCVILHCETHYAHGSYEGDIEFVNQAYDASTKRLQEASAKAKEAGTLAGSNWDKLTQDQRAEVAAYLTLGDFFGRSGTDLHNQAIGNIRQATDVYNSVHQLVDSAISEEQNRRFQASSILYNTSKATFEAGHGKLETGLGQFSDAQYNFDIAISHYQRVIDFIKTIGAT